MLTPSDDGRARKVGLSERTGELCVSHLRQYAAYRASNRAASLVARLVDTGIVRCSGGLGPAVWDRKVPRLVSIGGSVRARLRGNPRRTFAVQNLLAFSRCTPNHRGESRTKITCKPA
jgi:hypothetical protein